MNCLKSLLGLLNIYIYSRLTSSKNIIFVLVKTILHTSIFDLITTKAKEKCWLNAVTSQISQNTNIFTYLINVIEQGTAWTHQEDGYHEEDETQIDLMRLRPRRDKAMLLVATMTTNVWSEEIFIYLQTVLSAWPLLCYEDRWYDYRSWMDCLVLLICYPLNVGILYSPALTYMFFLQS